MEQPRVFSSTTRFASKDYVCMECGGTIPKNFRYTRDTGIWDNEWQTYRLCIPCRQLRDQLLELCDVHEVVYGELIGLARDYDLDIGHVKESLNGT